MYDDFVCIILHNVCTQVPWYISTFIHNINKFDIYNQCQYLDDVKQILIMIHINNKSIIVKQEYF